ncbi:uncharacterized protein LOC123553399 [Mercenaria mercenaria]|uniref:uncharacterized protein LOC123553399 n=1 Tax=Mercenaria mercenaria TaxID=6596 RepID=UPI00234EF2A0|nr:uncharacterized protein LOC123553399 [Mercenaria mercenaria]
MDYSLSLMSYILIIHLKGIVSTTTTREWATDITAVPATMTNSTTYSTANSTSYSTANTTSYSTADSTAYSTANSTSYSIADSTAYSTANSTTYSTSTSTEYPNATTPEDPDYTIVYIAMPASILAVVELVILIFLIIRCYRAIGANNDHVKLQEHDNDDGLENQLFAVVNRAYTGFVPREWNSSDDKTHRPISQKRRSNDAATTETKILQRRDPGYIDIDIKIDMSTDEDEVSQHIKGNEKGFVNKAYSDVEGKSRFLPSADRSTCSDIQHTYDKSAYNKDTKHGSATQVITNNTDTDGDTEYDHAVNRNRRSYQTFESNRTYSRLGSVVPRHNPFLRLMEETTSITDKQYEGNRVPETGKAPEETSNGSSKEETASRDLKLAENQSPTRDVNRSRQYNYSKVNKIRKSEKDLPKPSKEHAGKSKEETDTKPISIHSEECCEHKSQNSESFDCRSGSKHSNVKKGSKCASKELKSDIDQSDNPAVQKEVESTSGRRKPDRKYEHSQVIKKTGNTENVATVDKKGSGHDPKNKMSFIVSEEDGFDDLKKNKKHEYINIKKQNTT